MTEFGREQAYTSMTHSVTATILLAVRMGQSPMAALYSLRWSPVGSPLQPPVVLHPPCG